RDIRVVWFYLRIISKNIQYRFRMMQYRFRTLLHRFQILLDDMWTVMFLAMAVDSMTNIWDTWYIGRSHLLTQGISHAMLSYRILAMLLLSELVQEALLYMNRLLDHSIMLSPCGRIFDSNGILVFLFHAFCFQGTSEVALTSPLCILWACKKVRNHNLSGRVILICRSAHVWRDIAAIILFDASKGLFLTAITFVPINTLACLYAFLIKGVWLTSPLVITSAFAEYVSECMSNRSLHNNNSSTFSDVQGRMGIGGS
ncbi:unnamed protein product, partial [Aureobasidium pullulans]